MGECSAQGPPPARGLLSNTNKMKSMYTESFILNLEALVLMLAETSTFKRADRTKVTDIYTEQEYVYTTSLMRVVSILAIISSHVIKSIGYTKCILRRKRSVISFF